MGSRLVGALAFVTFLHLGARVAAPADIIEVSDLDVGPAPALLDELRPEGVTGSCELWVVYDPECPACNRASKLQAEQEGPLPLDVIWVGETASAVARFSGQLHPEAHLVQSAQAGGALKVRAVPAAFLVSEGEILYTTALNGAEALEEVAQRCTVG